MLSVHFTTIEAVTPKYISLTLVENLRCAGELRNIFPHREKSKIDTGLNLHAGRGYRAAEKVLAVASYPLCFP